MTRLLARIHNRLDPKPKGICIDNDGRLSRTRHFGQQPVVVGERIEIDDEMAARQMRTGAVSVGCSQHGYSNRSGRWLSSARSWKRVNSPWKPRLTVPVGP